MNMTEIVNYRVRIADIWDAWLESDGTRRDYDKFEMAMKEINQ
jgi:hypothetical protein